MSKKNKKNNDFKFEEFTKSENDLARLMQLDGCVKEIKKLRYQKRVLDVEAQTYYDTIQNLTRALEMACDEIKFMNKNPDKIHTKIQLAIIMDMIGHGLEDYFVKEAEKEFRGETK